jgi:hypothetical protein
MSTNSDEPCEEDICITTDNAGLYKKYTTSRFDQ